MTGALGLAVSLGGCAVGPDYRPPDLEVPGQWNSAVAWGDPAGAARQKPELAQWWRQLGDPELDSLIEDAVTSNLDVAEAKARVREARAGYRAAGGRLLPTLDSTGSANRSRSSANGGSRSQPVGNQFQYGFDTAWELDLFGANARGAEAAGYALEAAEQELRAALLTLIGDVTSNYVEARGFHARIALAERTAATQRETEALTRVKLEAGTASGLDLMNAKGQASSTEANIAALHASYATALHRLGVLLGREPAALADRLDGNSQIPTPSLPIPLGVPADVLTSRPDLRQAERQLAQATAEIGEAEAARYPDISLGGSLATSGTNLGDLARSVSLGWSFGPTISLPVFNAGQLEAAVEVQEAQRDQAFLAYRAALLTALEDVENAVVALTQERRKHERLEESAAAFREAARLAKSLYQNGASSFLDVLDAERSLYSAEDALIESQVAITANYIALNKALGGGWDGAIDASRPEIVDTGTGPHLR